MKKRITQVDKKKGFGKDKSSILFLTLNTNTRDLVSEELLRKVGGEYFDNIEEFLRFLHKEPERNNPSYIDEVDIETVVEKGKKEERVHLHSLIRIKHRTKLQIDLIKTQAYFCRELGLKNIYLNVKFIPDDNMSLLKYLRKPAS